METNELRIGNYLFDDETNDIMIVSRIETEEYTEWNSGNEFNIICLKNGFNKTYFEGNFRPIPLTEDILLKCGFKKELDAFYRKNKSQMIEVCFHDNGILITNQSVCLSSIKYLHQLQNLYFALTNQELTITL